MKPVEPIGYPKRSNDMVEVLVVLRRATTRPASTQDRGTEYRDLVEETNRARTRLIHWLKERSVWGEVEEVGETNAFNIVPLTCSRHVASMLQDSPDVEAVSPADAKFKLIE